MGPLVAVFALMRKLTLLVNLVRGLHNMTQLFKIAGFVGAMVTGIWLLFNGEPVQGGGIITAALSSATFLQGAGK